MVLDSHLLWKGREFLCLANFFGLESNLMSISTANEIVFYQQRKCAFFCLTLPISPSTGMTSGIPYGATQALSVKQWLWVSFSQDEAESSEVCLAVEGSITWASCCIVGFFSSSSQAPAIGKSQTQTLILKRQRAVPTYQILWVYCEFFDLYLN